MDPISSPYLTTSPDSDPRTTIAAKPRLPQEIEALAFGANIGQLIFDSPLSTPTTVASDDQPVSEHT